MRTVIALVEKTQGVRATWFSAGNMLRQLVDDGHVVANHTQTRPNLTSLDPRGHRQQDGAGLRGRLGLLAAGRQRARPIRRLSLHFAFAKRAHKQARAGGFVSVVCAFVGTLEDADFDEASTCVSAWSRSARAAACFVASTS